MGVAKCFNSTGFNVMENPKFCGVAAEMFMAGSVPVAKKSPASLRGMRVLPNATTWEGASASHFLNPFQASGWTSLRFRSRVGRSLLSCSSAERPTSRAGGWRDGEVRVQFNDLHSPVERKAHNGVLLEARGGAVLMLTSFSPARRVLQR